jgi:hypothetical protein
LENLLGKVPNYIRPKTKTIQFATVTARLIRVYCALVPMGFTFRGASCTKVLTYVCETGKSVKGMQLTVPQDDCWLNSAPYKGAGLQRVNPAPDNGSLHQIPETFSAVTAVLANMMADYTNKVVLGAT